MVTGTILTKRLEKWEIADYPQEILQIAIIVYK